jgi:hypothetical protein
MVGVLDDSSNHHIQAAVIAFMSANTMNHQAQRQRLIGAPPAAQVQRVANSLKWQKTRTKKSNAGMPNHPIEHVIRSVNTTVSQNEAPLGGQRGV